MRLGDRGCIIRKRPVPAYSMHRHEHIAIDRSSGYFLQALLYNRPKTSFKRRQGWNVFYRSLRQSDPEWSDRALADAVSRSIEARQHPAAHIQFKDAVVLVGEQGAGKDYLADRMRGYTRLTMSDIVRAIVPAFRLSDDTEGKIQAGHMMRKIFGKHILTDLAFREAFEKGAKRVVMTGPRSSLEIRAARKQGARIIGLVADADPEKDRIVRLNRVIRPRETKDGAARVMTKRDFLQREKQEHRRIARLMRLTDKTVVNNRRAADVIRELS